jgi:tocopherol O-methyltransferase
MTTSVIDEHRVQEFYDVARYCYEQIMGEYWHHGDPEALAVGLPRNRACQVLEERIASLCGLRPGERALDFGSGIGGPTRTMARVTGASFLGVTNNERLNQMARERTAKAGLTERVSFMTLDDTGYKNLPFGEGTFDGVTFFESVCHIPDKAALFRELARVLKPGSRLAGMDWIKRPFGQNQSDEQIQKLIEPIHEHIAIPWLGSVEDYKQLMEEAGLQVVIAKDLFPNVICMDTVQTDQNSQWLGYDGPEAQMFRDGEKALFAAREAGVFSIAMWVARKPA